MGRHTSVELDEQTYLAWKKTGLNLTYIIKKGLEHCLNTADREEETRKQIFQMERAIVRLQEEILRREIKDRCREEKNEVTTSENAAGRRPNPTMP